jgi:predicted DCC family thiol-disulfide oxidoreductase YuxK
MNTESILRAEYPDGLVVVYDGECPFCSNYVRVLTLRESAGAVHLVDARGKPTLAARLRSDGYDLNQGMVALYGATIYFGADCVNLLALLSTPSGLFNRINGAVFRSRTLSRLLYPVLRCGRNLTLRLMGRSRIGDAGS